MHDTKQPLSAIEYGDGQATEQLLPLIYDELHRLAAELVARERPGQTLEATALVNEAYLRLVEPTQTQHWHGRSPFLRRRGGGDAADPGRTCPAEACP
ncbi:MAG: ECF-type sigma factor [Isosphaeraceae bacterium]